METKFIVKTAAASMPNSCWGKYGRVAVLEVVADGPPPKIISARARGVVRVVRTWERLFWGSSSRCAFERARRAAQELADELNEAV